MRVLIAGCGYVGTVLAAELATQGHRVWGLRRSPGRLPEGVRPLALDLLGDDLRRELPPVDRVVFAVSADRSEEEAYRAAYVEASSRLLEELHEMGAPVDRFLFVSSTAVYGDSGGEWVDETTRCEPESFRGRVVLEGERTVLKGLFPATVLRLGGIYGPDRTRLLDRVRSGEARCPGDGPIWSNRIHRDDAAGALAHLLSHPDPAPVYVGVDEAPTPLCEVYRGLAEMLGAPEPEVDPRISRERANKRCSSRLLRESGFTFRYPTYREGYGAMLEGGG